MRFHGEANKVGVLALVLETDAAGKAHVSQRLYLSKPADGQSASLDALLSQHAASPCSTPLRSVMMSVALA